eukprot:scaffold12837_cov51-Attheya_sp.AAC.1
MEDMHNTAEKNRLAEVEEEVEFDVVMQEWLVALEETRRLTSILTPSNKNQSSSVSSSSSLVHHVQACQRGLEHVYALGNALQLTRSYSHNKNNDNNKDDASMMRAEAQWAMIQHASQKSQHLSWDVLQHVTTAGLKPSLFRNASHHETTDTDPDSPNGKRAVQGCVARIMELTLLLHHRPQDPSVPHSNDSIVNDDTIHSMEDISSVYAQYQRKVLRQRSKDAILSLGTLRNQCQSNGMSFGDYYWTLLLQQQQQQQQQQQDDNHDTNNESNSQSLLQQQPHGHAIMIILGETSSLIHPLQEWNRSVGPVHEEHVTGDGGGGWSMPNAIRHVCDNSVDLLHAEAQSLALTVLEWLVQDCDILKWNQTISQQQRSPSDDEPGDNPTTPASPNNLGRLDAILEEMALCCQVVSRYCTFVTQEAIVVESSPPTSKASSTLEGQLQELSFYYSTLETYLMEQNFAQAMELATPVEIVVGRPNLLVPSVVEDALYMCTRAMDRAAGTLVDRALWTVGHWVCQLWSIPTNNNHHHNSLSITTILTRATSASSTAATADSTLQTGVYKALLMDGRGCFVDPTAIEAQASSPNHHNSSITQPPNSGSFFATALLDALDQDLGDGGPSSSSSRPPPMEHTQKRSSAPSSGGLFSSGGNKLHQQAAMDAEMCTLNGIHSASTACMSLSTLFQTYQEQPSDDEDEDYNDDEHDGNDDPSQINGATTNAATKAKPQQIMNPSLSKLQFAQEELESHTKSYRDILSQQCREVIAKWCGSIIDDLNSSASAALCFHRVNSFVQQERYNLNSTDFSMAESEARLQQELVDPIQNGRLFQQILLGKCDAQVSLSIAKVNKYPIYILFRTGIRSYWEMTPQIWFNFPGRVLCMKPMFVSITFQFL